MCNIIKENLITNSELCSKDELTIVFKDRVEAHTILNHLDTFIGDLSEGNNVFKYSLSSKLDNCNNKEVSIKFLFDTIFISAICSELGEEIQRNNLKLEGLNKIDYLSSVSERLLMNRIEDLNKRTDDLVKQQKVVKMQLLKL